MAPATVLLIDSDSDSIAIYSMILRHHGYDVLHALDGDAGLRLARDRKPDLVISALFFPPATPSDLLDRLRDDHGTAHAPLIVLDSTPNLGRDPTRGRDGLERLTKPCEPSRLLAMVERMLSRAAPTPS